MVSRSKLAARESAMRILCSYGGMESAFAIQQPQVVIGRASCSEAVDLDLAPDLKVSRRHARIWTEGGKYWIEDLNSSWGTQVNGIGIRGKRSQEHTSELQSPCNLVCRLLLEKKKKNKKCD